jgi:hypothetical protein
MGGITQTKLGLIGASAVLVNSGVLNDGTAELIVGDSYEVAEGYQLPFAEPGLALWPDLATAAITMTIGATSYSGVVSNPTTYPKSVYVVLSKTATAALTPGTAYPYEVKAALANGHVRTLARGTCKTLP